MTTKTFLPVKYAEWKIENVIAVADCDRETAWNYLVAEEWCVTDALTSLLGDRRLGTA